MRASSMNVSCEHARLTRSVAFVVDVVDTDEKHEMNNCRLYKTTNE
jgi:hypothetical protein